MWTPKEWIVPNSAPKIERAMGWVEQVARRKLGQPDDLICSGWQAIGKDTLWKGCVGSTYYLKGKRAGQPKYDGREVEACVTVSEVGAAKAEFVRVTGLCGECQGDAIEWRGWNHITGHKIQECRACKGSGRAK